MKKCIVFGACGYLGMHLVHFLNLEGIEVDAYDMVIKNTGSGVDCKPIDICSTKELKLVDWNVDVVYHFAGLTGTHAGFKMYDDYIRINEIGLINVLTAISNSGQKPRFVLPSTRLVYKGSDIPLKEDAPKEAKTVYAANKIVGELLLNTFQNAFGIDYTVFRICVPYGNTLSGEYSYGTMGFFINQAKNNNVIRLYGDGSLRRTFTHVEDLCQQVITISQLEQSCNNIYNTSGEDYSLFEVASLVANKYGATVEFIPWPENDLKIESGSTVFDSKKLEEIRRNSTKFILDNWIDYLS